MKYALFQKSSDKTINKYVLKTKECLNVIYDVICPGEGEHLKEIFLNSLGKVKVNPVDETTFILKEIYMSADTWSFRRQILSVLAANKSYDELKKVTNKLINIPNCKYC